MTELDSRLIKIVKNTGFLKTNSIDSNIFRKANVIPTNNNMRRKYLLNEYESISITFL